MKIADHMPAEDAEPTEQAPQGPPPERGGAAPQEAFGEPATPEEQEAYDRVVTAASDVLYDEKTNGQVMQMLQAGADNPAQAIADAATIIITQLDEKSGGTIPEVVIIPAAAEVAELVGELAQKKRIFEVDQNVLGKAGQLLLVSIADQYGVSEEELAELVQSVDPQQAQQIVAEQSKYGVM